MGENFYFLTYFFGTLFTTRNFGAIWMPILGWAIVAGFAAILAILIAKKNKETREEYTISQFLKKETSKV